MAGGSDEPGRSVLSRAVAVLSSFDREHRELTAPQIAERSGMAMSTTYRLLAELRSAGMVTRDGGRYRVGHRVWAWGLLAPVQTDLRDVAAPLLADVHVATRATVHLVVREQCRALFLERVSGPTHQPVISHPGSRLPLHATAAGKVLLAHAPTAVRDHVLDDLPRRTAYTVVHRGRLSAQLDRVREHGYATTSEEMALGTAGIAVPISRAADPDTVVAAIGVVLPAPRRHHARSLAALQVAGLAIGRRLT